MHGLGPKIHLKSPLAPQPEPLKLNSMPPSRAHSLRIYIRSLPNFLCSYLRACAFEKWWGAKSENARVRAQNPSKITLGTQASTTETWFNATFYGPILREYTSDHSQTFCAYTSGHERSENGGGPVRKCTGWGPKSIWVHPEHPSRYLRNLIQCHLLRAHSPRIYTRSFPHFLCLYRRTCAFEKRWGAQSENARVRAQNPSKITLSSQASTTETWFNATF